MTTIITLWLILASGTHVVVEARVEDIHVDCAATAIETAEHNNAQLVEYRCVVEEEA